MGVDNVSHGKLQAKQKTEYCTGDSARYCENCALSPSSMSASVITMLGSIAAICGAMVTRSMMSIENFAAKSASANFGLIAGSGAALLVSLLTGAALLFGNAALVAGVLEAESEEVGGMLCDGASDAAIFMLPQLLIALQ